nr:BLTX333 [Nephila pilipes]
MSTILSR